MIGKCVTRENQFTKVRYSYTNQKKSCRSEKEEEEDRELREKSLHVSEEKKRTESWALVQHTLIC